MKRIVVALVVLTLLKVSAAQEETSIENIFQGTRLVNAQSANLADKGELQLLIQHRFGDISGGFYELFGLDQATMRIGFEYGFGENLNFGIGRSTFLKTFDAFGKYRIAGQTSNFPLSIVVSAGGSLPSLKEFFPEGKDAFADKTAGNVQLHLAKTIGVVGVQITPGYLKTGYLPGRQMDYTSFTLGAAGSVKLSKKVSANIEYLHPFNSDISDRNPLSIGVDLDTGGHLFQLVLSNSQPMYEQGIYTNVYGDWTKGRLFFGFNLIREFDIAKPIEF